MDSYLKIYQCSLLTVPLIEPLLDRDLHNLSANVILIIIGTTLIEDVQPSVIVDLLLNQYKEILWNADVKKEVFGMPKPVSVLLTAERSNTLQANGYQKIFVNVVKIVDGTL